MVSTDYTLGLQLIYDDVLPQAEQIAVTHFGMTDEIEMDNWHLIRQFWEADGGSGFGGHQDERDGEPEKPLQTSRQQTLRKQMEPGCSC